MFLDDQILVRLTESITIGTRLCSNRIILPKLTHIEDSQIKLEPKLIMNNNSTDDIKIKEEPIESEEDQQIDLSSSNTKPASPILPINTLKSKETKKIHRNFFFCFSFTFQ